MNHSLSLTRAASLTCTRRPGHAVIGVQDVLCTAQSFHDMGCGLCVVCAGSSLFGCAAADLLLDGSCVCGKVGDSIAVLTAGGLEVHLHDEEAENEVHHHDLHQTHQHVQRPVGAANACGQVQHQKVNDAVGGADRTPIR